MSVRPIGTPHWGQHAAAEATANQTIRLERSQAVRIRLEYRGVTGDASLALKWPIVTCPAGDGNAGNGSPLAQIVKNAAGDGTVWNVSTYSDGNTVRRADDALSCDGGDRHVKTSKLDLLRVTGPDGPGDDRGA